MNRGRKGVNSLPKTVTRQRHGCDLNTDPYAPESGTLTTLTYRATTACLPHHNQTACTAVHFLSCLTVAEEPRDASCRFDKSQYILLSSATVRHAGFIPSTPFSLMLNPFRRCCPHSPAARAISPAIGPLPLPRDPISANPPRAAAREKAQTDGRTPYRFIDPATHTAGSADKQLTGRGLDLGGPRPATNRGPPTKPFILNFVTY